MKKKFDTTLQKRFKILYLLVRNLYVETGNDLGGLLCKLDELAGQIEIGHPLAAEALTYYEDNILSILSTGMEVKELN